MAPDTFNYFVAGYVVVFIGIAGYILSLVTRSSAVKRKHFQREEQNKAGE